MKRSTNFQRRGPADPLDAFVRTLAYFERRKAAAGEPRQETAKKQRKRRPAR